MSTSLLVVSILIPILFVLIIVGIIIYFSIFASNKYKKYLNNINEFLKEPYVDTLTTLRTIDINLRKKEESKIKDLTTNSMEIWNDKDLKSIQETKEHFAIQQLKIEDNIFKIKNSTKDLSNSLVEKKLFKAKKTIKEIENIKKEIEKISIFVDKESKNHIDQQKELENNIFKANKSARYVQSTLLDWTKKYANNVVFVKSIKRKMAQIKELEAELGELNKNMKYSEGLRVLRNYRKELWNVCVFGNRIEGFVQTIEIDATEKMDKFKKMCDTLKDKLESDLSYLEIQKYFDNASYQINNARKYMYEMDVINTMSSINGFYSVLLDLNQIVNNEVAAFNFIHRKKMDELEFFYKDIAKKYIEIENEYKKARLIDKNYIEIIARENMGLMDDIVKNVNVLKNKYEIELNRNEISNASKQYKYKSFMYSIKQFNELFYKTKKIIENFYYEGISQRLRYDRLKKIFLKANGEIIREKIILSIREKELIEEIEKKKTYIDNKIVNNKKDNETIEKEIDIFYNLIVKFVEIIMKKALISKIFISINEQYSHLRINNTELNIRLAECEEIFMEGNYERSLETAIHWLRREMN